MFKLGEKVINTKTGKEHVVRGWATDSKGSKIYLQGAPRGVKVELLSKKGE